MRLKILFGVILLALYTSSNGQTIVTGIITDSLMRPIPAASVYLSKTTVGTISDNKGGYTLTIPQNGIYEMTASSIGFSTNSFKINAEGKNQVIDIKLSIKITLLSEITVSSKEKNRVRNFALFKNLFLGETPNARECRILNPEDIRLHTDPATGTLSAFSIKPIKITNNALGYTITYDLVDFEYNEVTGTLKFTGYNYFEPLSGNQVKEKRWTRNRLKEYYGSRLHFFRALYSDSLSVENFKILGLPKDLPAKRTEEYIPFQVKNLFQNRYNSFLTIFNKKSILIKYTENHPEVVSTLTGFHPEDYESTLEFLDTLKLYRNGFFEDPYNVIWGGKMANERLADMLPFDFMLKNQGKESAKIVSPVEIYLESQRKSLSPDQVFVHLDRNIYSPGDTIQFKAYIMNRFTGDFETRSISLYSLLFDEKNAVADSTRFRIEGSGTAGWMVVPDKAAAGKYHFIAFTSFMQNFDPRYAFQCDLYVKSISARSKLSVKVQKENSKNSLEKNFNTPFDEKYFEITFLPEGGTLVKGLEQRIGFNATGFRREPVHFEGLLRNSKGSIIDTIRSGEYGPGSFICSPENGMYVELTKGGGEKNVWLLPEVSDKGICLSVKPVDNSSFAIDVQSDNYNNDTCIISGVMNSVQILSQEFKLDKKQRVIVETDELPGGVATITIFNKEFKPLAERLYYVNSGKHLVFNIISSAKVYRPEQETELAVSVSDGSGNPVEGVFSISVVDSISGHNTEIYTPGIESIFNFHPHLRGNLPPKVLAKGLENLTDEERDLLLLVYGWRKYDWNFDKPGPRSGELINYDLINIKVLNDSKEHGNKRLDLVALEGPSIIHLPVSKNGEYLLPLDSLPEITRFVTLMPDSRNKKKITEAALSIPFNKEYFDSNKLITPQPVFQANRYTDSPDVSKSSLAERSIVIPEVKIKGFPPTKKVYQNIYEERYNYADIRSSTPEMIRRSFDIVSIIYGIYHPYKITDNAIYFPDRGAGRSFFFGVSGALFVLDGVPLYANGWQIAKTIPVMDIASVSILLGNQARTFYGLAASGGVIFINTTFHDPTLSNFQAKWKSQNKNNNMLLPLNIYRGKVEFYSPKKIDIENNPEIQRRSTIYWNSDTYFSGKEPTVIKYTNLKHIGPVIISVNGVSRNNLSGSGKARYLIK